MRMSRGRTDETAEQLTGTEKRAVIQLVRAGKSDREIADLLDVRCGQVEYHRIRAGVRRGRAFTSGRPAGECPGLRPSHVSGEVGSDAWFESCDRAFKAAATAAYESGGW